MIIKMLNQREIDRAAEFAKIAHINQKRKFGGHPYIVHPNAVAAVVAEKKNVTTEIVQAAWLHDVVEDTDFTLEDIRGEFGDTVARYVEGVTREKGLTKRNYIRRFATEPWEVCLIKLADIYCNLLDTTKQECTDDDFKQYFARKSRDVLVHIGWADAVLAENIRELINTILGERR